MSASAILRWTATALAAAGIPYMVVGSFASSAHGQPRTTMDLDVVIDPTIDGLRSTAPTSTAGSPRWAWPSSGPARRRRCP